MILAAPPAPPRSPRPAPGRRQQLLALVRLTGRHLDLENDAKGYAQARNPANRRRTVEDHRRIHQTIRRGRAEAAMSAMQHHIDILTDRFLDLRL